MQAAENFKDVALPLMLVFWSFGIVFLFCELGQRLTDQFNEIDKEINRFDWFKFPLRVRKVLPIIMNGTQSLVEIKGFGNIPCSRDSFQNVRFSLIYSIY